MARPEAPAVERPAGNVPDRNLALELVRVTEAAAMGAGRWIGRGDTESADLVDIEAPARENVERVAKAKGRKPSEITVVVLERDRHEELIAELRDVGAKVLLIPDGDVAPAIAAAQPTTGVDLLMGVGGTPE